MNQNFDEIGKSFVKHYYDQFDTKEARAALVELYHPNDSCLTFEGLEFQGAPAIGEKLKSIPLENMMRTFTAVDCQPTADGGVLINVLGQLKNNAEHDKPMGFCQCFILKPSNNTFYVAHDIFRLTLHNH